MSIRVFDTITIDGNTHHVFNSPLDAYWSKSTPKPHFTFFMIGCFRDYQASWDVRNNELYLVSIIAAIKNPDGISKEPIEANLQTIFPKAKEDGIKAIWYSGKLFVQTSCIEEDGIEYTEELHLTVNKGDITGQETIKHTKDLFQPEAYSHEQMALLTNHWNEPQKTSIERPRVSDKNKWLYPPTNGFGKMEKGVVDSEPKITSSTKKKKRSSLISRLIHKIFK